MPVRHDPKNGQFMPGNAAGGSKKAVKPKSKGEQTWQQVQKKTGASKTLSKNIAAAHNRVNASNIKRKKAAIQGPLKSAPKRQPFKKSQNPDKWYPKWDK